MVPTGIKSSPHGEQDEVSKCLACDNYIKRSEGFRCPQCKRSPLCHKLRAAGKRECESCVFESQMQKLHTLKKQEKVIRSFLRFLQFLFLVCAIFFVATRMGLADAVVFLQNNILVDNVLYFGGGAVIGHIIFYIILSVQRNKAKEFENQLMRQKQSLRVS
jgi:hypothetical protein